MRTIIFDTETTGLTGKYDVKMIQWGFADSDDVNVLYDTDCEFSSAVSVILSGDFRLAGHNVVFDLLGLAMVYEGWEADTFCSWVHEYKDQLVCTQAAHTAFTCDARKGKTNLEAVYESVSGIKPTFEADFNSAQLEKAAKKYNSDRRLRGFKPVSLKTVTNRKHLNWHPKYSKFELAWAGDYQNCKHLRRYAEADVTMCRAVYRWLDKKKAFSNELVKSEMLCSIGYGLISHIGISVDMERVRFWMDLLEERKQQTLQASREVGLDKPSSYQQVRKLLGVSYSDASRLAELAERDDTSDVDKRIIECRLTHMNLQGAYSKLEKYSELVSDDGVIPVNLKMVGTVTGRSASVRPNMQQVPKRSGKAPLRKCFRARDGHLLVSIDYASMEIRGAAELSGDEQLRKDMANGVDPHQRTADLAGCSRSAAKTINFALIYGSTPANAAKSQGLPVEVGYAVDKAFSDAYPGFDAWRRKIDQQVKAMSVPYTELSNGWRAKLTKGDLGDTKYYCAANYLIQGHTAFILRQAFLKLGEAGYWPYVRLIVHDEIVFELLEDQLEDNVRRIVELMTIESGGVTYITDSADEIVRSAGKYWQGGDFDPESDTVKLTDYNPDIQQFSNKNENVTYDKSKIRNTMEQLKMRNTNYKKASRVPVEQPKISLMRLPGSWSDAPQHLIAGWPRVTVISRPVPVEGDKHPDDGRGDGFKSNPLSHTTGKHTDSGIADVDTLRSACQTRNINLKKHNWALVPYGWVGVDVDHPDDLDSEFLELLKQSKIKVVSNKPDQHPQCGTHIFRLPGGGNKWKWNEAQFGGAIDLIKPNRHRYQVGPGSVHPSRSVYSWVTVRGIKIDGVPLFPSLPLISAELRDALTAAVKPRERHTSDSSGPVTDWLEVAADRLLELVVEHPEHQLELQGVEGDLHRYRHQDQGNQAGGCKYDAERHRWFLFTHRCGLLSENSSSSFDSLDILLATETKSEPGDDWSLWGRMRYDWILKNAGNNGLPAYPVGSLV